MRRLGKDFVNKAVLSMDEGRMLGRIQDLYLDATLERVLGLYMGSEGLFKRKSLLIPREAVVVLGIDAVLVSSSDVFTDDQALPAAKEWFRRDKLVGREVDTPGGTRLGLVGDVVVEDNGAISAFALSKVYVEGPLAESRLVERTTVIDTGQEDGRMNVDLTALEQGLTGQTPVTAATADNPFADLDLPPGAIAGDPLQVEVEDEPKKND